MSEPVMVMCPERHLFLPPCDPSPSYEDEGPWVDLSRRVSLRRLLKALADHRVGHPGDTLSFDDLVAIGWPGERIIQRAARNRLHVALSTLRRFGADIEFHGDGWRLPPTITVIWTHDEAEQAA